MKNLFIRYGAIFCTAFMLILGAAQFANAATFTVNNLGDAPGQGIITLRDAINSANASPGPHTINFSVAGTITPLTPLPAITQSGITITGTTAPGYVGNNSGTAFNGTLVVELDGSSAGSSGIGLQISASNCTIAALVINRFEIAGVRIDTGTNNTLAGNFIGTDTTGTIARGNFNRGVLIVGSTLNNIGLSAVASRNVISGNSGTGISITGGGSATIRRALIGTDKTGTLDLGNTQDGIRIADSSNSVIGVQGNAGGRNIISGNDGSGISIIQSSNQTSAGGNTIANNYIGVDVTGNATMLSGVFQTSTVSNTGSGVLINAAGNTVGGVTTSATTVARNIISGNRVNGVSIGSNFSTNNSVSGNYIGVGADGTTSIGNRDNGVQISNLAANNAVGGIGTTVGACDNLCNLIANNGDPVNSTSARAGIYIDPTGNGGNAIRGNSIYSNAGIGIDLSAVGATANDVGDPDIGPNNIQNFPVVSSAETNGNITGSLNSTANTTFAIDFYSNTLTDGAGSEGRTFIGSTTVTTDAGGDGTFDYGTTETLTVGQLITATATATGGSAQAIGDSSEFSATRTVITSAANGGQGNEGDIAERPNGSGGNPSVQPNDVNQARRFLIGIDTFDTTTNEFQRADAAPPSTRGDGTYNPADVNQIRRYQIGIDAEQTAGGPTQPSNRPQSSTSAKTTQGKIAKNAPEGTARRVFVESRNASAGTTVNVNIRVDAVGDETEYGFRINFDNTVLSNPTLVNNANAVTAGSRTCFLISPTVFSCSVGAFPNDNPNSTTPAIGEIPAGTNQILATVSFDVSATATGTTPLTLTNVATSNDASGSPAITSTDGMITFAAAGGQRRVFVESRNASAGTTVNVNIRVDAVGDETEYGFRINFDNTVLSNPTLVNNANAVTAGSRTCFLISPTVFSCSVGAFPNDNPNSTTPAIGEIPAGTNQILATVSFDVSATATGTTPLTLTNVATSNDASGSPAITSTDGMITILAPTAAGVSIEGRVLSEKTPITGALISLTDSNGNIVTTRSTSFGYYRFEDVAAGQTYTISVKARRFNFTPQTITVNDNLRNLNLYPSQ